MNPEETTRGNKTPLNIAISKGYLEIVTYLSQCNKITVNNAHLYLACRYNNLEVVKFLISYLAPDEDEKKLLEVVNSQHTEVLWTPFMRACHYGNMDVVRYFVEQSYAKPG